MPNFAKEERRALTKRELELATQARKPAIDTLSDGELSDLITALREARDRARRTVNRQARQMRGKAPGQVTDNRGAENKLKYLAAALRRASAERNRRAKGQNGSDLPMSPANRATRAVNRANARSRAQRNARAAQDKAPATPEPASEPAPKPDLLVQALIDKAEADREKARAAQEKHAKAVEKAKKKGGKKHVEAAEKAAEKAKKARRKARKSAKVAKAAQKIDV